MVVYNSYNIGRKEATVMQSAYGEIAALSMEEAALERSAAYLHAQLSRFLKLKERVLSCRVEGDGDTITDQTPAGGAIIPGKSVVILYANEKKSTDKCVVPTLLGRTPSEANTVAVNAGLLIRFSGTTGSESSSIRVLSQNLGAGTEVDAGTVITVQLGDTSVTD